MSADELFGEIKNQYAQIMRDRSSLAETAQRNDGDRASQWAEILNDEIATFLQLVTEFDEVMSNYERMNMQIAEYEREVQTAAEMAGDNAY